MCRISAIRILARGSPASCHSGIGAGCPSSYTPRLMRIPRSVAARLLPIDQLSSGVRAVMPSPYRSPMMRPFHVATKAAVITQRIAHRPLLRRCVWQLTFDNNRHEVHHGLIHWQSYAPLAPEKLRGACDAARKRDMNCPVGAIDHGLAHFCALCIRGGEISHILGGEIRIEASDKDRRAHNLRKARRVML